MPTAKRTYVLCMLPRAVSGHTLIGFRKLVRGVTQRGFMCSRKNHLTSGLQKLSSRLIISGNDLELES